MKKFHKVGHYIRERLKDPKTLKAAGFTKFKTKVVGAHRIILAFPPGRRVRGIGVTQAILHPLSEEKKGEFTCRHGVCRKLSAAHE